jgi:hypothetical protein
MAVGVATNLRGSTDVGARLRAAKNEEDRRRKKSWAAANIPFYRQAQAGMMALSMMSTAPQFNDEASTDNSPQTQSMTAGEEYQRAFRQRQVRQQIGNNVGLDLNRQPVEQEQPIDQLIEDFGSQQAELMDNNQRGLDTRSAPAKRAAQESVKDKGLEEGFKALQDEFQKKMSAYIANSSGAIGEVIDSFCEDLGVTQALVFVQGKVQAVRTILTPAPPSQTEITSIQDLRAKFTEAGLDAFAPRFNISTPEGIEGLLKELLQMFVIGFVMVVIGTLFLMSIGFQALVVGAIYDQILGPLSDIYSSIASYLGF